MKDDPSAAPPQETRPVAKAAFFCEVERNVEWIYGAGRRQRIEALTPCFGPVVTTGNFERHAAALDEVEAVFSTWGMPLLNAAQLDRLPRLHAVFYAAGSVQAFARPYLERGVAVISASASNAVPVAEFTLAQILLANKGFFRNIRESRRHDGHAFVGAGNFETTVALLGAGQIGRKVIELLRPFALRVIVFDPFLADEDARRLGVRKVSLEAAFLQGNVVSNHLADLPATTGMITGAHFASMRPNAAFINTARPATVAEGELAEVMRARPDLSALLDVVSPEAAAAFHELPNVAVSTHIAGSQHDEVLRMADDIIAEFESWRRGEPLRHGVDLRMLETMA